MIRHFAFTAFLSLASLARAHAQTNWYVDASVPGPGTGTVGDPYSSIKFALQQTSTVHGDTVLVAPGVYTASILTGRRVTVRSSGGPLVTAIRPDASGSTIKVVGFDVQRTTFEGFTVYGNASSTAIQATEVDLKRCIVIGDGQTGLGLGSSELVRADHCTVYGFHVGAGTTLHGASVVFSNSIVYGNDIDIGDATVTYTWYASSIYGPSGLGPPDFFDGTGHDYHLLASSGCIDAGDPAAPLDPDGSRADMGAVPFDASYAPFTIYCTAKLNSLGCAPTMQPVNSASISSGRPFWIRCTNQLNQKNGLMFYGFAPKNTPYQGGYLCVQSPTRRTPVSSSGGNVGVDDCSGVFEFEFNALIQSGSDPLLELGTEVFCQWWSRDPAASFGTNRSDAVRFTIGI